MSKFFFSLSLLFLLLSVQIFGDTDNSRKIVVFGTAEKEVIPDKMEWHLIVNNTAKQLETTAEEHNRIVKQVISFLKSSKIEESKIQTSEMQFGVNWQYRDGSQIKDGYFASTNISFSITDLKTYKHIWIGLSKIENVNVNMTRFDHTQITEFQNEVRKKALLKAQEKAKEMANTLSLVIGDPIEIEEDQSINDRPWEGYMKNVSYSANAGASPQGSGEDGLAPGKLKIAMKVKVVFELRKN